MKKTKTLSRLIFFLSLTGVLVSFYLTLIYWRGAGIGCSVGGCETVRNWALATRGGKFIPVLGLIFYSAVAVLTMGGQIGLIRLINLIGLLFSLFLTFLAVFVIKSVCLWCVISLFLVAGIFVLSLKIGLVDDGSRKS